MAWGSCLHFFRSHLQHLGAEDTPKLIQNQGQLSPSLRDLRGLPGPSITCCAPGRTRWVSSRLPTPLRKLRGTKWSAFSYISLLKINKYLLEANGRLIKITVSGNTATSLLPLPPKTHPLFLEELLPLLTGERERPTSKFPLFRLRHGAEREQAELSGLTAE